MYDCKPSDLEKQNQLLTQIFGNMKGTPIITAPFYCDYGCNISIGKNTIIGAGSVVNKSIPENVIAAGNPSRVIRKITEADKKKHPIFDGDIELK